MDSSAGGIASPDKNAESLPALWEVFSERVSERMAEQNRPRPRYYAEKVDSGLPALLERHLRFRKLVSVRDPRDMFLSISSFNRKRGFAAFSRLAGDDDWAFARRFAAQLKARFPTIREVCEAEESLVVKYEDLANDLPAAAARFAGWLGVDLDPRPVLEPTAERAGHMTSATVEASVARWKRELPDDINAFLVAELSEELQYFSYDA